jgi:crossover junction endodeoxyribonuclease RuvC
MIVLGVDPGTRITGYGLVRKVGSKMVILDYGCIRPPPSLAMEQRLVLLFEGLDVLMEQHRPEAVAIELQFVLKNVQSTIKLGMAKAMALLVAARKGIPVFEYAPTRAKQAVVGNGQASKHQVQRMMQAIFRLPTPPEPEDAADALALALCHIQGMECTNRLEVFSKRKLQRRRSSNVMELPTDSRSR